MAQGFTRQLNEPTPAPAVSPSGSTSIFGAVGNFAKDITDAAINVGVSLDNQAKQDAGTALDTKLYNEVQTYAGGQQAPALVGQTSTDPAQAAAESSPGVQSAVSRINQLADIHQQGNMKASEFAARTAAIVQQAKLAHPRYAAYLEDTAKNALGWSPTQEQVSLKIADENAIAKNNAEVQQTFVKAATDNGVAYFNPDGTVDFASTTRAGQNILQTKAKLEAVTANVDLQTKEIALAKAQQGPELSTADRSDMEYRGIISATLPSWNEHSGAMLSQVPQAIDRLKKQGLTGEALNTAISQEINQVEARWNNEFNNNLNGLKNPPSAKAVADARAYYKSQFDNWRTYFGGPLDEASTKARAVNILKNNNQIDYHKSAPVLTGLNDVFGAGAIGPMVNQAISVGTPGYNTAQQEAAAITTNQAPPAEATDHLRNATHVANGQTTLADYPKNQQKPVLSTMLAGYDTLVKNPNDLTDKQLSAYGNIATNIVAAGLQGSAQDVTAAAAHTNSPSALRTFDRFASSSQDGTKTQLLAQGVMQLNAHSIATQAKNLKPQTFQRGAQNPSLQTQAKIGAYSYNKVTYSPVYNPQTGQIEVAANKEGGRTDFAPVPVDMQRAVQSMNASLGAIAHLKQYGNDYEKGLNDRQLKQAYIQQLGIPLKTGVAPVDMPKEAGGQTADFTNSYNTKLDPQQEQAFQGWLQKTGRQGDLADYDLRGAWLEGARQAANGHFTDKFKKPNHPTFSNESIYSGQGATGGKWVDQGHNHWVFQASPDNLKYRSKAQLQEYFNKREPGSTLEIPEGDTGPLAKAPNGGPKPDIHKVQNKIESNNNPNAVSKKGAKGINQVMDATNLDPGYGVTPARNNSPQERERVGRDYIDALTKHYGGNVAYALIAYNWGPGNADKWLQRGGNWSQLPQETQDYLSRALTEGRKQQVALGRQVASNE